MLRRIARLAAPALGLLLAAGHAVAEEDTPVIEEGKQVSIEYTLKLDDGTTADSNVGESPLVYEQGAHQILPALEEAMAGASVGETREVTLPPEKGYGERNPELLQEVETSMLPEGSAKKGTRLVSQDQEGNRRVVEVHEVKGEKVVLDLNHPLAGETLHFDVKVVGVD